MVEPGGEERLEVTKEGVVSILPVRMNMNVKTMMVEEIEGQKKRMHLASFRYLLGEIKQNLIKLSRGEQISERLKKDITSEENTIEELVESILSECLQTFESHKEKDNDQLIEDQTFRGLVVEMLEIKMMAISKFQYYFEDKSQWLASVKEMKLRTAHRLRIDCLQSMVVSQPAKAENIALQLCQLKGLVMNSIDKKKRVGRVEDRASSSGRCGCRNPKIACRCRSKS